MMALAHRAFLFAFWCALWGAFAFAVSPSVAAAAPKRSKAEIVREKIRAVSGTMGSCACTIPAAALEADDAAIGQTTIKDLHGDDFKVSVVNDVFALKLFQEMTVQRKIPFGFPEDGCFARAHEMSFQLGKKGIATGKIFATGAFRIDTEKIAKGHVTWGFHVAPFFIVDNGQIRELWVIDPSLFYEPIRLESWLARLTEHAGSRLDSLYVTNRYIYHPSGKNRRLSDFDPDDLARSKRIMKRYLKRQILREKKDTSEL